MKTLPTFLNFTYAINNILTPEAINMAINNFCLKEYDNMNSDVKLCIHIKAKTIDDEWLNISPLQVINVKDINKLKEIIKLFWSCKSSNYKESIIEKLVLRYTFSNLNKASIKYPTHLEKKGLRLKYFLKLPHDRLFKNWGKGLVIDGENIRVKSKDYSYNIMQFHNEYHVLLKYRNKDLLNYHDVYNPVDNDSTTFMRYIDDYAIYYSGGTHHIINKLNISMYTKKSDIYWFL